MIITNNNGNITSLFFCQLYWWFDPLIKDRVLLKLKDIRPLESNSRPYKIMLKCNKIPRLVVREVASMTGIQVWICVTLHREKGDYSAIRVMTRNAKHATIILKISSHFSKFYNKHCHGSYCLKCKTLCPNHCKMTCWTCNKQRTRILKKTRATLHVSLLINFDSKTRRKERGMCHCHPEVVFILLFAYKQSTLTKKYR